MNNEITNYVTRSNQLGWTPLMEEGVDTKGIFVKVLQYDESSKRAPVILLKFEPGARYPYHNHPAGEHVFVLQGDAVFEGEKLSAGDYLFTPPDFKHEVTTENGCVLFFVVPEEVVIMER